MVEDYTNLSPVEIMTKWKADFMALSPARFMDEICFHPNYYTANRTLILKWLRANTENFEKELCKCLLHDLQQYYKYVEIKRSNEIVKEIEKLCWQAIFISLVYDEDKGGAYRLNKDKVIQGIPDYIDKVTGYPDEQKYEDFCRAVYLDETIYYDPCEVLSGYYEKEIDTIMAAEYLKDPSLDSSKLLGTLNTHRVLTSLYTDDYDKPYNDAIAILKEHIGEPELAATAALAHNTNGGRTASPSILDTPIAQEIFNKAIEKGYMERDGERYKWKKSQVLLTYLIGRLLGDYAEKSKYGAIEWVQNKRTRFPDAEAERLFGISKLSDQRRPNKCAPTGYQLIDLLF